MMGSGEGCEEVICQNHLVGQSRKGGRVPGDLHSPGLDQSLSQASQQDTEDFHCSRECGPLSSENQDSRV